jgi:hypothetical protein
MVYAKKPEINRPSYTRVIVLRLEVMADALAEQWSPSHEEECRCGRRLKVNQGLHPGMSNKDQPP